MFIAANNNMTTGSLINILYTSVNSLSNRNDKLQNISNPAWKTWSGFHTHTHSNHL